MLRYTHLRYRKPLLPPGGADVHSECRMTNDNLYCFTAGDDRVNEQPGQSALQSVSQSVSQLVSQSVSQSASQSACHSVSQSAGQSAAQAAD